MDSLKVKTIQVPVRRFDDLLASGELKKEEMPRPILLKVDTEGTELQTLIGFGSFLKEIDYIILELTNPAEGSSEMIEICTFLKNSGFNQSRVLYAGHHGSSPPDYLDLFFWKSTQPSA